jgi:hypothetical protein
MSQLKRTLCFGIVVSILGLMMGIQLGAARPRPEKANWDNVKQLLPGDEVKVVLKDAKPRRGLLQTVTDGDLVLRLATGDQTFARQNILRVSSKGQSHRGRNAAEGAAIGALGVGAAISIAAANPLGMLAGAFLGGGPGALIGAVLPTGGWHDIYRVAKTSGERSSETHLNATVPDARAKSGD